MSKSRLNYQCTFNLDKCIKALGLEEKGKIQQFVTNEFMKNVQPFVPFDLAGKYDNPGGLSASAHIETSKDEEGEEKKKHLLDKAYIENGTDIVWPGPYARRLYYHPEYNFQGKGESESNGLGRGAYWADRYMQNGGREEIEKGVRAEIRKLHFH